MKYNNKKCKYKGFVFDSKKERNRYVELLFLEKSGDITSLELQPKFEILPSFEIQGKKERAVHYVSDFRYIDQKTGGVVVEDVKGHKTQVYSLKRKMFLSKYGNECNFREVF